MKKFSYKFKTALLGLLCMSLAVVGCHSDDDDDDGPSTIPVSSIAVKDVDGNTEGIYVEVGDTLQLTANVAPESATNKEVTWASGDEETVIVSADGVITGKTEGSAKISVTAKDGSGVKQEIDVEVKAAAKKHVESVSISANYDPTLLVDDDLQLTATLTPADPDVTGVKWVSSDTSIVTVDANGYVKAVATGDATITAVANDRYHSEHKKATFDVKVGSAPIPLTGLTLSATAGLHTDLSGKNNIAFVGEQVNLSLVKEPAEATISRDPKDTVYSVTKGEGLAEFDETKGMGVLEIIGVGEVEVSVTTKDRAGTEKTATLTIIIRKPVKSIEIAAPEGTSKDTESGAYLLARDDDKDTTDVTENQLQLTATVTGDATVKDLEWKSSDEKIAIVDTDGKVLAKVAGDVTITATAKDGSGVTQTAEVHVFIPVNSIALSSPADSGRGNSTIQLAVKVEPADADPAATFKVTKGTAKVDEKGVVTLPDVAELEIVIQATSKYNTNKTATITLKSVLDKSKLEAAIKAAEARLKEVGDNTTTDVTKVGKYLVSNKQTVETAKTAAETQNTSGTSQKAIDAATKTLNEAVAACNPIAITLPKDVIPEDAEYVLFSAADKTDGLSVLAQLPAMPELKLDNDSIFADYETTTSGIFVKRVKAASAFSVSTGNHTVALKEGFNNKMHISLFASKKVRFGFAIYAPYEVPGVGRALPSFTFDPETGKVTADVCKTDGTVITGENGIETKEVGSGIKSADNWWSVDFKWNDIYEKQPMNDNLYGIVFYPIKLASTEEGSTSPLAEFFFDNLYAYKAEKTPAELVVEKKETLKELIATAEKLYSEINGNESSNAEDYGKFRTGTAATLNTAISTAKTELDAPASTVTSVEGAITALGTAIETAQKGEWLEEFKAPVALEAVEADYIVFASDVNDKKTMETKILTGWMGVPTVGVWANSSNTTRKVDDFKTIDGRSVKRLTLTGDSAVALNPEFIAWGGDLGTNKMYLHLALRTKDVFAFKAGVWDKGTHQFTVKDGKVYADDEENAIGEAKEDANGWAIVDIDVTDVHSKTSDFGANYYAIQFIKPEDVDSAKYYIDDFFYYQHEPTGEELIAARKQELADAVAKADTLHDGATEGEGLGQFTSGSREKFKSAINAADTVAKSEKTAAEYEAALSTLLEAQKTFLASMSAAKSPWTVKVMNHNSDQWDVTVGWGDATTYALKEDSVGDVGTFSFNGKTATTWWDTNSTPSNTKSTAGENAITYHPAGAPIAALRGDITLVFDVTPTNSESTYTLTVNVNISDENVTVDATSVSVGIKA